MAACTIDTNNRLATNWTAYTGFGMASGSSAAISSHDANYWRVSLTKTATAVDHVFQVYPAATTNATQSSGTYDATVQGSAVFCWSQLELGSFASTYIPTTTVAVTRNADVLTYPSSGNILGTVGWASCEFTFPQTYTDASPRLIHTGSAAANGIPLYLTDTARKVALYDGTAAREGSALTLPVTTPKKVASTWGGSTSAISVSGTVTAAAFDGSMDVSIISIANTSTLAGNELFGGISNVRIGQRQLSNSEEQAITRP